MKGSIQSVSQKPRYSCRTDNKGKLNKPLGKRLWLMDYESGPCQLLLKGV